MKQINATVYHVKNIIALRSFNIISNKTNYNIPSTIIKKTVINYLNSKLLEAACMVQ